MSISVNIHQQLLQDTVVASGHVETCCLISTNRGHVKASSIGFEVEITMCCIE